MAVQKYFLKVSCTYSSCVRANRQSHQKYIVHHTSVKTLCKVYKKLEDQAQTKDFDPVYNYFLDLCEQETANSLDITEIIW
ncbi:MAG: hypothetical protein QNJ64_20745 [Crocosphaera sp.]|nr:hypothetical protein [Crocosphaera sp.]